MMPRHPLDILERRGKNSQLQAVTAIAMTMVTEPFSLDEFSMWSREKFHPQNMVRRNNTFPRIGMDHRMSDLFYKYRLIFIEYTVMRL